MGGSLFKSFGKILTRERFLFLVLVLLEYAFIVYLIGGKRLVGGHDAFYSFPILYYFYNNIVASGEVPQWIPYLTHGTTSTWFQVINGTTGILHTALFPIAGFLKNVNFLTIFYSGIFVDRMLLLTGTWLLGTKFFKSSYTRFFVCSCVMGSTVWMMQLYFNFYFFFSLPLILYFFHEFLKKAQWRFLFAAINLFLIQIIGNVAYFIPVLSLAIFLYCLLYCLLNVDELASLWSRLKWGKGFWICLIYTLIALAAMEFFLLCAKDPRFVNLRDGATQGGQIALDAFLTYAGNMDFLKWQELFAGVSPATDYTLFIGFVSLPLFLMGFLYQFNRKNVHFTIITLILLCFSMATVVSTLFYYIWPLMKYYRHLALVTPLIKIFLCFIVGFGFEDVFIDYRATWQKNRFSRYVMILFLVVLVAAVKEVAFFAADSKQAGVWVLNFIGKYLPHVEKVLHPDFLTSRLGDSAIQLLVVVIFFAVILLLDWKRYQKYVLLFVLVFHVNDIYGYYFLELNLRTLPVTAQEYQSFHFTKVEYPKRRSAFFDLKNPRESILNRTVLDGVLYWTIYPFILEDQLQTRYCTEHWQKSFDHFMRSYWGQKLNDQQTPLKGYVGKRILVPQQPALFKIAGVSEDKIQFFSNAFLINDEQEIANLISDPAYTGDILFLSDLVKTADQRVSLVAWDKSLPLSTDFRLSVPYDVTRFDANHVELTVNNPRPDPVWLFYSDVWHPGWRAEINGKSAKVFQADLAYKAVNLPPGNNQVHFFFKSGLVSWLTFFWGLNCWLWVGIIFYLIGKILFGSRMENLGEVNDNN